MGVPWIAKHVPVSSEVPQQGVTQLISFINGFKKSKKKACFLYGPSGVGKTAAAHAVAKELGLELLEVNASDVRNADGIESVLGVASKQMSLFGGSKLILVDEVDSLSGTGDRGGASAIANVIAETKFPVILTANDPWESKLSPVRSKCQMVEFAAVDHVAVSTILKKICDIEGVKYDDLTLKTLARRSGGDIRAAINDLQTLAGVTKELTKDSLSMLGDRDREESMQNALIKVFKNSDPAVAATAFDHVPEDLDGSFLWVDENLPNEYTNAKDLARAYDMMARADVFRGRIKRRQHWHFLVYVNDLLSAGVSVSKDQKYPGITEYKETGRILKIWQANMKYQKRKAIAGKLAPIMHSSLKRTIRELPFIQVMFKKNTPSSKAIADAAELDPEEVEWLQR